jgi:hypothetical protein
VYTVDPTKENWKAIKGPVQTDGMHLQGKWNYTVVLIT